MKTLSSAILFLLASAAAANAASLAPGALTGTFGFNSFVVPAFSGGTVTVGGETFSSSSLGGVNLPLLRDGGGNIIFASDGSGIPRAAYDLRPNSSTGNPVGAIVEITGTGDFAQTAGFIGVVKDISSTDVKSFIDESETFSIPDFITIYDTDLTTPLWAFKLDSIGLPSASFDGAGTTISNAFFGTVTNLTDGSKSKASITNSIDFVGLNKAQAINSLISDDGNTTRSYSSSGIAEPLTVPEGDTVIAVVLLALGFRGRGFTFTP
jgi:hypothetical protein